MPGHPPRDAARSPLVRLLAGAALLVSAASAAEEPVQQCLVDLDTAYTRCMADADVASSSAPERPDDAFGNPSSLLTGAKRQRETDVERVGLLGFDRRYDSAGADSNAGLGQGWTHAYATRLWSAGDAGLQIRQSDGRRIAFTPVEPEAVGPGTDGPDADRMPTWRARSGADGVLRQTGEGRWAWTLPDGRRLRFLGSRLADIHVPGRGSLALRYEHERLTSVTDDAGRSIRLEYTPGALSLPLFDDTPDTALAGHLATTVRPDGTRIRYAYDGRRNLVRATWPDGTSRRYHYEDPHWPNRLTGITDRRGVRTNRWRYGDDGTVVRAALADDAELLALDRHEPAADGLRGSSTVASRGGARATWEWEHDPVTGAPRIVSAAGTACRSCPPAGPGIRYVYDAHGLPAEEIRADGGARLTRRDALGRTVERRRRHADGTETLDVALAYEADGRLPIRESRPSVRPGATFDIEYARDAAGLVEAITERGFSPVVSASTDVVGWTPIERTVRIERVDGRVTAVDGPRTDVDDVWRFERDAGGELVALSRPDGRDVRFLARDASGRITRFAVDDEPPVSIERDGDGRPLRIEHRGLALGLEYDAEGRVVAHVDPWGRRTRLELDRAGRLSSLVDDLGRRVAQRHDIDGHLVGRDVFGAEGDLLASVAIYRNLAGEIVRLDAGHANADGTVTERSVGFERDAMGRLLAMASSGGGTLGVERDAAGDAVAVTLPGGERHDVELDATRRVARHVDAHGGTTHAWRDDFGRLVAEHHRVTGLTRHGYGTGAHWTTRLDADGAETVRRFDAADRLVLRRDADGEDRYEYDAETGRLLRAANAASDERFAWSAAGDLIRHERTLGGVTYTTAYAHDEHGRLVTRTLPGGETLRYHYHRDGADAGRLRAITRGVWFGLREDVLVGEIDLDARDGRTGHVAHNGLRTVHRFAPNGEPLSIDVERAMRVRYEHDELGRIVGIDRDGTLERYDHAGDRLVGAVTALGSVRYGAAPTAADAATAAHDGRGRRLRDGAGRRLVWNAAGRLVAVREGDATVAEYAYNAFGERVRKTVREAGVARTTLYLHDGTALAAEVAADTGAVRHYVHLDERPVALIEAGAVHALHTDHLGTVRLATDDEARASWAAELSAYGEATVTVQRIVQPLRLPGQYHDAETGLHYNLNRYYDPATARYLSPDPVGLRGGFDRHAYAEGSPLHRTDPLGLSTDPRVRARDPAVPAKPVADQSFTERLETTFGMVAEYGGLPERIGEALRDQLTTDNLAATAAVVGLFAALQATPLGWFADVILVGAAWYEFGSIAVDLVKGLVDLATSLAGATTRSDLCSAADALSGLLEQVVSEFAGDAAMLGAAGAVKGSRLIRRLFSSNRDDALSARPRPCARARGDGCGLDSRQIERERRNEAVISQLHADHGGRDLPGPAVSRGYAIDRDGKVIETDGPHVNMTWRLREGDNPAAGTSVRYERNADGTIRQDERGIAVGVLVIKDPVKYMNELKRRFRDKFGKDMNPRTEAIIRTYVMSNKDRELSTQNGAPGTHAEIFAMNELFDKSPELNVSDITLGTVKLYPDAPEHFPACANCSGILDGVDIITGRAGDPPGSG